MKVKTLIFLCIIEREASGGGCFGMSPLPCGEWQLPPSGAHCFPVIHTPMLCCELAGPYRIGAGNLF
jgi:hypothetical protein